ncbi:hypothetical protein [Virgibacillus chiguensis]|nr:hypothetical protein [Virgibacillus chiguensis]
MPFKIFSNMNKEDKQVANVIDTQLLIIERAVQLVITSFQKGGRSAR